jgi:hypothetical protein
MKRLSAACAALLIACWPAAAAAWGSTGHRIINLAAMRELPIDLPLFLQSAHVDTEVEDLGPELDRLKGAGYSFDRDLDPEHYVDVGDNHRIAGTISLLALPFDMEAYAKILNAAGTDPYRVGYLPYGIADGWERLRMDFAYWRVFDYLAMHAASARNRAIFASYRRLREGLVIRDIGVWGHLVADGSQPLHVTTHYNDHHIHAFFEGTFVREHVTVAAVTRLMQAGGPRAPLTLLSQAEILHEIGIYLSASNAEVGPLYALVRNGGFRRDTPQAVAFATARVADGARELRDLIVSAWDNSRLESVGYPEIRVGDVLEGKVHPLPKDFGGD